MTGYVHRATLLRIAGAAAVLVPFLILGTVLAFGVNLPYWDEWEYAHFVYLEHTGALTLADIWQPHKDHRIFFTTLVFLALERAGGWDVVREQCVSVATLVATQAALWGLVRRTVAAAYAPFALLLISLALYNISQVETLSWGAQMGWFIANLCVVLIVWLLTREDAGAWRYTVSMVIATIGSLTMSQGAIAWLAGLVCILAQRRRVPRAALWLAVGSVVVSVSRSGTHADPKLPHVAVLTHLPDFSEFVLAYLGAPLAGSFGAGAAALLGALTVAILAGLVIADMRSPDRERAFALRLPWYAIATYALVSAPLTASVRLGMGLQQALESRYTTIATLLDVAIVGALATYLGASTVPARTISRVAAVAAAVFIAGVASQSWYGFHRWEASSVSRHADLDALARGDLVGDGLHWNPARLPALFGELRDTRTGVFGP